MHIHLVIEPYFIDTEYDDHKTPYISDEAEDSDVEEDELHLSV
jgi:hypothetical protein